jgi:hypothetical protein
MHKAGKLPKEFDKLPRFKVSHKTTENAGEPMNTKGKSFFDLSTKEKKRIVETAAREGAKEQQKLMNRSTTGKEQVNSVPVGKTIFEYEYYETQEEVRAHIQACEGKHTQQVAYSTFHDSLTQICFGCLKIRSNILIGGII